VIVAWLSGIPLRDHAHPLWGRGSLSRSAASRPARHGPDRQDPAIAGARRARRARLAGTQASRAAVPSRQRCRQASAVLSRQPGRSRIGTRNAASGRLGAPEPRRCHRHPGAPPHSGVFPARQRFGWSRSPSHWFDLQRSPAMTARPPQTGARGIRRRSIPVTRTARHAVSRIGARQTPPCALGKPTCRPARQARQQPLRAPRCGRVPVHPHRARHAPHPATNPRQVASITAPGSPPTTTGIPNRPSAATNAQSIHKDIHSRPFSSKPGGPAITRDKYSCPQREAGRRHGIFPDSRPTSRKISPFRRNR